MEESMRNLLSFTSIAAVILGGFTVEASELPTFEKFGFPITSVQVAVLGSAGVKESSPVPTLTHRGMPASPHQVMVLTQRRSVTAEAAAKLTTVGMSAP
jgi:hypothetical protein